VKRWVRAILIAACSQTTACLDDPPTFAPRDQIPPFIIAAQVVPPINLIYTDPSGFSVNAPFRSEDVNIDLIARLYLDLRPGVARASHGGQQPVPAGILEDDTRSVTVDFVEQIPDGCHSITLILTYENNFNGITLLPTDDTRAARVVWWLNIGDIDGDTPMSSCPAAPSSDPE
jgi:hypothetical protein